MLSLANCLYIQCDNAVNSQYVHKTGSLTSFIQPVRSGETRFLRSVAMKKDLASGEVYATIFRGGTDEVAEI